VTLHPGSAATVQNKSELTVANSGQAVVCANLKTAKCYHSLESESRKLFRKTL